MVSGSRFKFGVLAAGVTIALGIGGCGGGGSSDAGTKTTSVSGKIVDGYIKGATVCVDSNSNGRCDSGEPVSGASADDGSFTITGVSTSDATSAPLVAVIPATAVDSDSSPATVGSSFVLMTPAGQTVVSPLTTLVQQAILKDSSLTTDAAATQINGYLSSLALTNADLLSDYVAGGNTTAHDAAKVVANSLKANYDAVKGYATGNDKNLAIVLAEVAKQALQSQGSSPNPALPVGVEDVNTLRASIVARSSAAAATQNVTISFDMVNAGTSIHCGDPITIADTQVWDQTATPPVKLATPVSQNTAGQMVDTRFYVSNVLLLDAAGHAVPLVMDDNGSNQSSKGVALLDFGYNTAASGSPIACTTSYNTTITGKVAPGTYSGVSMTIGVPIRSADFGTKLNHVNAADTSVPAPLQVTAVNWTWQSGRKFTKIEFLPDTPINTWDATNVVLKANAGKAWNVHIGSTGCAGNPTVAGNETACTNANRVSLRFDAFDAATQKVVFDVAQLFKNADLTYDGGGPLGCMSGVTDPECPPVFTAMGIQSATGRVLLNGDGTANQTVFSVTAK